MDSTIFKNTSEKFFLLDYSPSHKQLVIRFKRTKKRPYNIDLLFKGVSFIHLPTELEGLTVITCKDEATVTRFTSMAQHAPSKYHELFLLKDPTKEAGYISAMAVGVFHSPVDILETIIGRYDTSEYSNEKQSWYKMM